MIVLTFLTHRLKGSLIVGRTQPHLLPLDPYTKPTCYLIHEAIEKVKQKNVYKNSQNVGELWVFWDDAVLAFYSLTLGNIKLNSFVSICVRNQFYLRLFKVQLHEFFFFLVP